MARLISAVPIGIVRLAIFSICFSAIAQDSATIEGMVQASPEITIPNALIELRRVGGGLHKGVRTEATGRFLLTGLAQGSYQLTASATAFSKVTVSGIALTLRERKAIPPITLPLGYPCGGSPGARDLELLNPNDVVHGSLSGIVVDRKNKSIPSVRVSLHLAGSSSFRRTTTDSQGRYSFDNLEDQHYWIEFTRTGYFKDEYDVPAGLPVQIGFNSLLGHFALEDCHNGRCDPSLKQRRIEICE